VALLVPHALMAITKMIAILALPVPLTVPLVLVPRLAPVVLRVTL
jgi:hypothetical protein